MSPPTPAPSRKLLIVEDDRTLREALVEEFEDAGFEVMQAENGLVAFDIVSNNRIDGVISDVRMPGGDGIEFLKRMNAACDSPPVLIFITGYSDLGIVDAYDLGAEAVVKKPFALDELIDTVGWMLTPKEDRWRSHQQAPRQPMPRVSRTYKTFDAALDDGSLSVGRGGVFIRDFTSAAKKQHVELDLQFGAGAVGCMRGGGIVQWVRPDATAELPAGSGVEFSHIEEKCINGVLSFEKDVRPRPYIPKR